MAAGSYSLNPLFMMCLREVEHNLFAGFCLFDTKAESRDGYYRGYQVDHITDGLITEAVRYIKKEVIMPEDWWFA